MKPSVEISSCLEVSLEKFSNTLGLVDQSKEKHIQILQKNFPYVFYKLAPNGMTMKKQKPR